MFQSFSILIKALIISFVMLMPASVSFAQVQGVFEEPPPQTSDSSKSSSNGSELEMLGMELPAISAKTYDLVVVRPSQTRKMVLFSKATTGMPDLGRVFLLREGPKPVMGFRVIKIYPEKNQIAARRIKDYPEFSEIEAEHSYRAFEKVGLITNVPENTPDDLLELNELEGGTASTTGASTPGAGANSSALASYDASSGSGKPPVDSLAEDEETEEDSDGINSDEAEGSSALNFFGFDVGSFRGINLPGGSSGTGFGIAYSRLLSHSKKGGPAIELSAGYYKSSGDVIQPGDTTATSESFTVTPLGARIRYHFGMATDKWSYYLYGGILYNRVTAQFGATEEELALAQTVVLGLGGGVLIPTGPNWFVRVNAGTDWLGLGLALRF